MTMVESRLNRSTIKIDEKTLLTTYTSSLLKVPYQFKLKSIKRKNPSSGNYFDYNIVEINTGYEITINQEKLLKDMNRRYKDFTEASSYLFGNANNASPKNFDNFLTFNAANFDYYINYFIDHGVNYPTHEQAMQLCAAEIMTLMAETIIVAVEGMLSQTLKR